jgi:hypothetical protein
MRSKGETRMNLKPVPPRSLEAALDHVRAGGELLVPTYTRCTLIDERTLRRFERKGEWLLREDGDGYRLRSGRGSVYLLPGQLKYR